MEKLRKQCEQAASVDSSGRPNLVDIFEADDRHKRVGTIFELEERINELTPITVPFLAKHKLLHKLLLFDFVRQIFLPEHERERSWALVKTIHDFREELAREWQLGYEDFQHRQGQGRQVAMLALFVFYICICSR